ncbi:hypothetical protein KQI63_01810 [bacterium]|nr:hypothetical protein [bacterium]
MMIAMFAGITAALRNSVIHGLHPLPDLVGHSELLNSIIAYGIGPSAGLVMTAVTISMYGSLLGVFLVTLGSFVLLSIGWTFGINARFKDVRAALVWSFVPYSWLSPIYMLYGLVQFNEIRNESFVFGTVYPWDVGGGVLSWLIWFDYAIRLFCLVWLVLKLSVAMDQPIWKTAIIVGIAILPPAILLVPWQGFGF